MNHATDLQSVTVSAKYQVVIPKSIRESLPLIPGQKLVVILKGRVISLVPELPLDQMRGFVRGLSTDDVRDEEDRV